jgi:tRNA-splicing ligase RtcB
MGMKEGLKKLSPYIWEVPKSGKMRVPARLFLSDKLMKDVEEGAIQQVANVASLPGIQKHALAMPDMHFGYGFPIGGVAALDYREGGLSPGGIGFDINCGVRVLRTNLMIDDVKPKVRNLLESIFTNVPSGVGKGGKLKLSSSQLDDVLEQGAGWAVKNGYGNDNDLAHLEENGCLKQADSKKVSQNAKSRGAPQLGTLGAGNHFLEIQVVNKIFIPDVAKSFGMEKEGQVMVMIHTGSRGLGHQVCTDYLEILEKAFQKELKDLPDRELVYAPSGTQQCEDYFKAMCCGANYAWANRQMINHWVRESMSRTLGRSEKDLGLEVIYDVAHNIAKVEEYDIGSEKKKVYVHRKGATRAFGPGRDEIPADYKGVGQPVLVPGSMGTASYILVGTKTAEEQSFSSVCHGAGRLESRSGALRSLRGEDVKNDLEKRGINVKAASWKVIAEEAPQVYKDVDEVVRVCHEAGLAKMVARLTPIGVVKG